MRTIRREDFQRNNEFLLYDQNGLTLIQDPRPGGYEVYNFGRGPPGLHNYVFNYVFLPNMQKKRRKF